MDKQGMLLIISGPSGSGKGTVTKHLEFSDDFAISISVTTRKPRVGEVDGKDYFFRSVEEFERVRAEGGFLEHAAFCGNFYGTPLKYVKKQIEQGKTVVLEIDVNGALQVKEKFEDTVLVFIVPPTMAELRYRLINRNTEDMETIEDRLKVAETEISLVDKYDYLIINSDVDRAVDEIQAVVKAESLKPIRSMSEISKFKGVM